MNLAEQSQENGHVGLQDYMQQETQHVQGFTVQEWSQATDYLTL